MAMSKETLKWINGDDAVAQLEAARKKSAEQRRPSDEIASGLSAVAVNGVVSPEDSRAVRTGEVPVVEVDEFEKN